MRRPATPAEYAATTPLQRHWYWNGVLAVIKEPDGRMHGQSCGFVRFNPYRVHLVRPAGIRPWYYLEPGLGWLRDSRRLTDEEIANHNRRYLAPIEDPPAELQSTQGDMWTSPSRPIPTPNASA